MHTTSYVQVPPQSTGKKIATAGLTELPYDNLTGLIEEGSILTGAASSVSGTVTSVVSSTPTTGIIFLTDPSGRYLNDEALQINNNTVALANLPADDSQIDFEIQKVTLVDAKNPSRLQKIDRFGAQITTFTDGTPNFGAFGTLSVGEPQINRVYRFSSGPEDGIWSNEISGSGTTTWDGLKTSSVLTVGSASGDLARRTTNFYHPYVPGVGLTFEQTIQLGDAGKAGCRRRWGYYDDNDGFFFELDGIDFYVVKRNSTSGTPVDTKVHQVNFNKNKIDGSDDIGFDLDLTKGNMFWIDIQWYGAGRVRYGVYEPGGSRLVIHEFEHANASSDYPFTRTATLPVRMEVENTDITSGTSQLRNTGAIVKHAHKVEVTGDKFTRNTGIKTVTTGNEVPLMAIRPKTTFNGFPNRSYFEGIAIAMSNIVNTGGGPVLFRVRGCTDAALTGSSWLSHGALSMMEYDTSATAINPAFTKEISAYIVSGGQTFHLVSKDPRSLPSFEISLNADGVTQPVLVTTVECLTGTNADVIALVNWEEIKF